ncbi:MAG: desulfoferrodoxin, partial [Clostridia bacterium]|nr:desulfoferrodoxin [Clostridia bacterium]
GSVEHPMTEEHHIVWVYLQTDRGGQRKCLEIGKDPVVTFTLSDEKPVAAYAYCNLHGLWKADI